MFDFTGFDWFNLLLLLSQAPFVALYSYRVLTPKSPFRTILWWTLLLIALQASFNLTVRKGALDIVALAILVTATESAMFVYMWKKTSRDPLSRVILAYAVMMALIALGSAAGSLINSLLLSVAKPAYGIVSFLLRYSEVIFAVGIQNILFIIASGFFARLLRKVTVDVRWSMFAILLIVQMFAQLMLAALLTWETSMAANVAFFCFYTLLCVIADAYVLRTFRSMVKNAELSQQVALLNQQNALERAQYEAADAQMADMRRFRHDYGNTLATIGALLNMGETEKIREILDSTASQLAKTRIVRTGNRVVDAVLFSKQRIAEEKGISMQTSLLWPAELTVSDTELMRIFANLLDNAIRYLETLPEGLTRRIEVTNALQGRMLALCFANTYLGDEPPAIPEAGDGDSAERHGHGLLIVRGIAEAYGGTLAADCSDGMLTFRVLLNLPAEAAEGGQGVRASGQSEEETA